jgi:hypothetical protein
MYNQRWCLGITLAYRLQLAVFGDSFSQNGLILPPNRQKFQERKAGAGVYWPLDKGSGEVKAERNRAMWISLFAFACCAAVCLSLAAVKMQSPERWTLRG